MLKAAELKSSNPDLQKVVRKIVEWLGYFKWRIIYPKFQNPKVS